MPFLGLACWALDMPFMKRYSRAYLLRHPERRGKDVETTRRFVKSFACIPPPLSISLKAPVSRKKNISKPTPLFKTLLPPKAAGIAMALNVLGKQFDKLLNVTLCYPDNNRQPFFDMLSGKLTRIVVHVDLQPIADELHGDYINDKSFKRHFQQWLNSLWQEKTNF
ncbi:acetyltransferase [Escherichia coli]